MSPLSPNFKIPPAVQQIMGAAGGIATALTEHYRPGVEASRAGKPEVLENLVRKDLERAAQLATTFGAGARESLESNFGPSSTWVDKIRGAAAAGLEKAVIAAQDKAESNPQPRPIGGPDDPCIGLDPGFGKPQDGQIAFTPLMTKQSFRRGATGFGLVNSLEEAAAAGLNAADLQGIDFAKQSVIVVSTAKQFPSSAYAIQIEGVSLVAGSILVQAGVHDTGGMGLQAFMAPRPVAIVVSKIPVGTALSVTWDND